MPRACQMAGLPGESRAVAGEFCATVDLIDKSAQGALHAGVEEGSDCRDGSQTCTTSSRVSLLHPSHEGRCWTFLVHAGQRCRE